MNNSKFAIDNVFEEKIPDKTPELRKRESELMNIIEALGVIADSKEWSTLKTTVFNGVMETLERQQKNEASKDDPDKMALAKINGQLVWARKYADLDSLTNVFRLELTNIRTQIKLYGKTKENLGRKSPDGAGIGS